MAGRQEFSCRCLKPKGRPRFRQIADQLIRTSDWMYENPELGLVAPGRFLDVARQAGLMPLITEVVIGGVLADSARLADDEA